MAGTSAAEVRVIVLTTFDEDEYVESALRHGVSGFLLKVRAGAAGGGGTHVAAAGSSTRP